MIPISLANRHFFVYLMLMLATSRSLGADAIMQFSSEPPATSQVGERVSLGIELLVPGQFDGATYFDVPEVEGAILMQLSDRPLLGTRDISGRSYVSAAYEFALYSHRGGQLQIPAIQARFGSREKFGAPRLEHRMSTPALTLVATAPPGAKPGEFIVSTSSFAVIEIWEPDPATLDSLIVGDALVRTITQRAEGVPSMLLFSQTQEPVQSVSTYQDQPLLQDTRGRQDLVGERTDRITYVFTEPGEMTFPALIFRWFDPTARAWMSQDIPAMSLTVDRNSTLFESQPLTERKPLDQWRSLILPIIAGVALLVIVFVSRSFWWWRIKALRKRYSETESSRWRALQRANQTGDPAMTYAQLEVWLAHFGLRSTWLLGTDSEASRQTIALQKALVGIDAGWTQKPFIKALAELRHQLKTLPQSVNSNLMPLNPDHRRTQI